MTDHETTRRAAAVFDDWAERGRGEGMEHGHLATAKPVLDDLPVTPGDRFLDLGCGIGWAARAAAAKGASAVGVDAAPRMLERARTRGGADFVRASFDHLPFRDGVFQGSFSMEALYYAGDVDAALKELHRVLASGARVDVLVDYYEENAASHGWPDLTGVSMTLLPEGSWRDAFARHGFRDVSTSRLRAQDPEAEAWKREEGTLRITVTR